MSRAATRTATGYQTNRKTSRTSLVTTGGRMSDENMIVIIDTTGGVLLYNMLQAATVPPGYQVQVQRRGAGNALTITRAAGDTLNGVAANITGLDDQLLTLTRVSATDWVVG